MMIGEKFYNTKGQKLFRLIAIAFVVFAIMAVSIACGGDEEPAPAPTATAAPKPTAIPTSVKSADQPVSPLGQPVSPLAQPRSGEPPAKGKAGARGRVISQADGQPLKKAVIRLIELYCPDNVTGYKDKQEKCVFMLDDAFSPSTFSDENGYFEFRDLEIRDYTLMVGDALGKNAMAKDTDTGYAKFWTTEDGKITEIGEQIVDY
jgi:hypothetical protein